MNFFDSFPWCLLSLKEGLWYVVMTSMSSCSCPRRSLLTGTLTLSCCVKMKKLSKCKMLRLVRFPIRIQHALDVGLLTYACGRIATKGIHLEEEDRKGQGKVLVLYCSISIIHLHTLLRLRRGRSCSFSLPASFDFMRLLFRDTFGSSNCSGELLILALLSLLFSLPCC